MLGGQVGASGHLTIGDGAQVAAQSGIASRHPRRRGLWRVSGRRDPRLAADDREPAAAPGLLLRRCAGWRARSGWPERERDRVSSRQRSAPFAAGAESLYSAGPALRRCHEDRAGRDPGDRPDALSYVRRPSRRLNRELARGAGETSACRMASPSTCDAPPRRPRRLLRRDGARRVPRHLCALPGASTTSRSTPLPLVLVRRAAAAAPRAGLLREEDIGLAYYEGEEIDLTPLVHEQALLALPTRPLCTEGCRGLCPRCGTNLNAGPCGCPAGPRDGPSWPRCRRCCGSADRRLLIRRNRGGMTDGSTRSAARRRPSATSAARTMRCSAPHVIACPQCGERTLRHRACPHCGTYRGRKVVEVEEG